MSDDELLAKAAAAAGEGFRLGDPFIQTADALLLAAHLGIRCWFEEFDGVMYACATPPGTHQGYDEVVEDETTEAGMLAGNRATVRAAASMAPRETPNVEVTGKPRDGA